MKKQSKRTYTDTAGDTYELDRGCIDCGSPNESFVNKYNWICTYGDDNGNSGCRKCGYWGSHSQNTEKVYVPARFFEEHDMANDPVVKSFRHVSG